MTLDTSSTLLPFVPLTLHLLHSSFLCPFPFLQPPFKRPHHLLHSPFLCSLNLLSTLPFFVLFRSSLSSPAAHLPDVSLGWSCSSSAIHASSCTHAPAPAPCNAPVAESVDSYGASRPNISLLVTIKDRLNTLCFIEILIPHHASFLFQYGDRTPVTPVTGLRSLTLTKFFTPGPALASTTWAQCRPQSSGSLLYLRLQDIETYHTGHRTQDTGQSKQDTGLRTQDIQEK